MFPVLFPCPCNSVAGPLEDLQALLLLGGRARQRRDEAIQVIEYAVVAQCFATLVLAQNLEMTKARLARDEKSYTSCAHVVVELSRLFDGEFEIASKHREPISDQLVFELADAAGFQTAVFDSGSMQLTIENVDSHLRSIELKLDTEGRLTLESCYILASLFPEHPILTKERLPKWVQGKILRGYGATGSTV